MAAGLLFLGISGAMLPGAEGFAESHYILNTALVLFLGYGWPILVGWTAVGLWFAGVQEGGPATETQAAASVLVPKHFDAPSATKGRANCSARWSAAGLSEAARRGNGPSHPGTYGRLDA